MTAGGSFNQSFFLANPDFSATDLTGCLVFGAIAKHPNALDALQEGDKTTAATLFETSIPDPQSGHYAIALDPLETAKLEEGKYVYSTVMDNGQGEFVEVNSGLIFVDRAFGLRKNEETDK